MAQIVALGDCNTRGTDSIGSNAYPEQLGAMLGKSVCNCGVTMSTTREMIRLYPECIGEETEIVLVQYGLVDSWKTFKYSPYVLYYPDNPMRKIARKLVKKYKKIARNFGLNRLLGENNVVPIQAYRRHLETLAEAYKEKNLFLIDTVPNQDRRRNPEILRYNTVMRQVAEKYSHVIYIDLYRLFEKHPEWYMEATHINAEGHRVIAERIASYYMNLADGENS